MNRNINLPGVVFSFIAGPIRTELYGERTILTHLQKYSHFGFMMTWPFCFHFWVFLKLQEKENGQWKPGTEKGIYFRTPGWRWDADLGMKTTRGYFGTHWD